MTKHGRKDGWTEMGWTAYKVKASIYYETIMEGVRNVIKAVALMMDRED
jgi:hypothetical protein